MAELQAQQALEALLVELEVRKAEAVATERYEEAGELKRQIAGLKSGGGRASAPAAGPGPAAPPEPETAQCAQCTARGAQCARCEAAAWPTAAAESQSMAPFVCTPQLRASLDVEAESAAARLGIEFVPGPEGEAAAASEPSHSAEAGAGSEPDVGGLEPEPEAAVAGGVAGSLQGANARAEKLKAAGNALYKQKKCDHLL